MNAKMNLNLFARVLAFAVLMTAWLAGAQNASAQEGREPEKSLFPYIQEGNLHYIRVAGSNAYWDYSASDRLFYDDPNAAVIFSLDIPEEAKGSIEDSALEALQAGVSVTTERGEAVPFSVSGQNRTYGLVLGVQLQNAPSETLIISFTSREGQHRLFTLHYTKTFAYTISSQQDENVRRAFDQYPGGIGIIRGYVVGKPYTFQIEFNMEVDKSSVDEVLRQVFPAEIGSWSLSWNSDTSCELTFQLDGGAAGKYVMVHMSGAKGVSGNVLKDSHAVAILAIKPTRIETYDFATHEHELLFDTEAYMETAELSPSGRWLLASERVENPMSSELTFKVLDRQGAVVKSAQFGEMAYPVWLADGDTVLYMKGEWARTEVWSFNAATGENRLFWKVLEEMDGGRLAALAADPHSGAIAIAAGQHDDEGLFTYDLHVFPSMDADMPHVYEKVGQYFCYEGPCLTWVNFIDEGKLSYSSIKRPDGERSTINNTYVLDLATGSEQLLDQADPLGQENGSLVIYRGLIQDMFVRIVQRPDGQEVWSVTRVGGEADSSEPYTFETNEQLLAAGPIRLFAQPPDKLALYAGSSGWHTIDLHHRTFEAAAEMDWYPSDTVKVLGPAGNLLLIGVSE
ncbi:hypothetical protein [Paenibacillus thalictri]|uniref:WD40 repeat domain-containing protein n=1 Tax=Paenibacillus thalictri TaxID=2527873 RepID=A0A4Q9DDP5_9BACL|nr:hypothetical protein [Paenibacillus thalictri]TBL69318.1 hypothetical protein EYB31_36265 [Paenibacillus thalictri]